MITKRKLEHLQVCLTKPVVASENYFDIIHLIHQSLPELNKTEIDCRTKIYKSGLRAPIVITGMTGGYPQAEKINTNLAKAAEELKIAFGVGSQRVALEVSSARKSFELVKRYSIPLVIANIGVAQLVDQKRAKALNLKDITKIIELIDADCLAIHLNFLQEVIQSEGQTNASGCLEAIRKIASRVNIPVILKETGAGISYELAGKIKKLGLGVDVAGLGGTSFASVEYYRAKTKLQKRLGETFRDWGIPTPVAILNCRKAKISPIIGSGGIRSGLDGAKAIALGSDLFGLALPLLRPALSSSKAVIERLNFIIEELKTAMFLTGARNLNELRKKPIILEQPIKDHLKPFHSFFS
jgi:isopentenyl-diphosphate delta-isomerase